MDQRVWVGARPIHRHGRGIGHGRRPAAVLATAAETAASVAASPTTPFGQKTQSR
jgi:hypothetical protein